MCAKLGMSRALLSEACEVTGHGGACLPVFNWSNANVLNRPLRVVSNRAVSTCFAFARKEKCIRGGSKLVMSKALLSEACECGESWRCLPSGL